MRIDFDDGIHFKKTEDEICDFYCRNVVATYNPVIKEFTFNELNMSIVPWDEYPEDIVELLNWIMCCQRHKDGLYTNTQLYSVEIY